MLFMGPGDGGCGDHPFPSLEPLRARAGPGAAGAGPASDGPGRAERGGGAQELPGGSQLRLVQLQISSIS